VKGILADADIRGQVAEVVRRLQSEPWREFWRSLNLAVESFESVGLALDSPDVTVWQLCQQRELVLITGNRNDDGPDSLEATIRSFNTLASLPVLTIADVQEFSHSRDYVERVVEQVLIDLLEIERYRGAGRLYIP
jgi:hypothetical protein